LIEVLRESGTLERAAVASYLNALHFHTNEPAYPLSTDQVVSLYNQYSGGGDIYPGMNLKQYFKTLYGGNNQSWPGGNQPCSNDNQGGGGD